MSRTRAARASRVDEKLRPGIEQALLNTLDPEAAKKAMEAMIPYFERPVEPTHSRVNQYEGGRRGSRKRTIQMLPSLQSPTAIISARERSLHTSSPLSVRSSQSEPTRYSRAHRETTKPEFTDSVYSTELPPLQQYRQHQWQKSPQRNQQFHEQELLTHQPSPQKQSTEHVKQVPPYRQPAYNSPAMLNLLRLERERNNNARNEIAKLTGWKTTSSNVINSSKTDTSEKPLKMQKDSDHGEKLGHVNQMKQLYMSGGEEEKGKPFHLPAIAATSSSKTSISQLTPSNLAQHNKSITMSHTTEISQSASLQPHLEGAVEEHEDISSRTPRVGDIDLDDAAFSLVSKYFQTANSSNVAPSVSSSGAGVRDADKLPHRRESRPIVLSSSQTRLLAEAGRTHLVGIDSNNTDSNTSMQGGGVGVLPYTHRENFNMTPCEGIGYDDVSNADEQLGGIEGLLMWSNQLEIDLS